MVRLHACRPFLLGMQHVLAMFVAGLVTLVQLWTIGPIGARLPCVMGTSSGFIGVCSGVAGSMGGGVVAYGAILGASVLGGLFEMVLGFMLATSSLISDSPTKRTALTAAIIPALILAVPVFDTMFAILRRALNHKPIMQADKGHIHHRMHKLMSQRRFKLCYISCILGSAFRIKIVHIYPQFQGAASVGRAVKPSPDKSQCIAFAIYIVYIQ